MASVSISANGAMSSPYLYSTATISEKSRSGTSVVLNVKIVTHLNTSSSFVGTGYKFTGTVTAYGVSKAFTLKESSSSWEGNADHTVTGTMTVNVPATTTSITVGYKCAVSGLESGSKTGTSKSLSLSAVLASVTSATEFSDTTNPTVSFSNPSKLKVRPYLNFYDKSGGTLLLTLFPATSSIPETGSVLSTSYTWDLDTKDSSGLTYRDKIRNVLGAKSTAYVAVGLNTYSGSTKLGYSSKGVTFTNVLEPPTFTNFTFKDVNEKTKNLTGSENIFISGYSTIEITIDETNKAIANKGATMSHYLINGTKYTYSDNFVQEIPNWGNSSVEIYAVDSRGLSTQKPLPCELISYTPLSKGNIVAKRDGGVGETTTLMYEGSVWNNWFSGIENQGIQNSIKSAKYTYQIGTGDVIEGITNIIPTITEKTFKFENVINGDSETKGFLIENAYNIVVTVEDELSSVEYVALVPSGIPAMAIFKNNVALHGKYDESLGGTQIYGDAYLDGVPIEIKTEQKILWEGGYYMTETHTISLKEKISEQKNGVVLVFSEYSSGVAQNYMFNFHFIPKYYVSLHAGAGVSLMMTNNTMNKVAFKYLYISDNQIKGHTNNDEVGTGSSGIAYTNNNFVLRYVIGV